MPVTQTQPRILVVDDEKQWRNYLREVLVEEKKYAVDTAEDYREAKAKLDEAHAEGRPFSVVTVDLDLKGIGIGDGERLLRDIARTYKGTSCIVVSGSSEVSLERANKFAINYGARFFGKKRFQLDEFLEAVETVSKVLRKSAHRAEGDREEIGISSRELAAMMDSDEIANLRAQLKIHRNNLNRLEELRANKGLDALKDSELMNEIEHERQEVAGLEARLQELERRGN